MSTRDGFVPEEFLGQILRDGVWLDYARGTQKAALEWYEESPSDRRVVDWIDKQRVIFGAPLLIVKNGDVFYTGPLRAGERVAETDFEFAITEPESGLWRVEASFIGSTLPGYDVWGSAATAEEAMRYALGAIFGPMDDEYDEARLRALIEEVRP